MTYLKSIHFSLLVAILLVAQATKDTPTASSKHGVLMAIIVTQTFAHQVLERDMQFGTNTTALHQITRTPK